MSGRRSYHAVPRRAPQVRRQGRRSHQTRMAPHHTPGGLQGEPPQNHANRKKVKRKRKKKEKEKKKKKREKKAGVTGVMAGHTRAGTITPAKMAQMQCAHCPTWRMRTARIHNCTNTACTHTTQPDWVHADAAVCKCMTCHAVVVVWWWWWWWHRINVYKCRASKTWLARNRASNGLATPS